MRRQAFEAKVHFRISEDLLARADAHARSEGMTLSELFRHSLRREIREGI
ncbi:ribbon-helix-helix protein, CopG family [Sphingobium phenoxybenzoativorans]|uniref:Ribbon-helix-helix protein, CopG family n=1 Tax=Sphingobium phenoxybenzoativorans TaxID=1592790 RepID=A0A975K5J4_9SPHN|nr:ribbon-helix-helix protein, CopG family [Sphingobium phenoxybenzoativorans]